MTLKLYYDFMSQPSRTLYILLKYIRYDFEPKYVDLRKGEHFSDAFSEINKLQRVPVINHNGFVLTESVAIIKYLSQENIIPESLYPKDSKLQARVNEFLEWHHIGLRLHLSMFFRVKFMLPIDEGKNEKRQLAGYQDRMESSLDLFNTKWLGCGNEFIAGNTITIADLFAASELEQPRMAGYDPKEKYENIAVWAKKVRQHFNPYYDDAHVTLNKIVNKRSKAKL